MNSAQPQFASDAAPSVTFRGHDFVPLISGAVYWPHENALLVADLHLEKMSSYARSGQLLPPYDTGLTLTRLEADIAATGVERVIALGDSFHRDEGTGTLQDRDRARLQRMTSLVDWVWLAGNHDPAPHELGGICGSEIEAHGLTLSHTPERGLTGQIAGHLHPAARVHLNGRSARRPCLVCDDNLMILPAYGSSTGSLNILSPAFAGLLEFGNLQVIMLGRDRVYPVHPKRLVGG